MEIGSADGTEVDPSSFAAAAAAHAGLGSLNLLEDDARFLEQQLSGTGQLDAPSTAMEQRRADLLFQLSNLQAERRLVDA